MATLQEFFEAVLPTTGWFYAAAVKDQGAKHKAYPTADALKAHAWCLNRWQTAGLNVYFTPCTWVQDYTVNDEGKNKNCRKHPELVHRLKSLWLDVDSTKQGKTVQESLKELLTFVATAKLPKPNVIVKTGGGLHAYWTFDEELTLAEWQPLADALRNACHVHGFKADHACTADHARILRLPGSLNLKYPTKPEATIGMIGAPVPLGHMVERLQRFRVATKEELAVNDEFSGGAVQYTPARMELVVSQCALLGQVLEDNGAQCSEPLWKNIVHMCAHASDGEEWVHKLSSGHVGYNLIATDKKLAACDTSYPPTKCETLEQNFWGAAPCGACPHKGQVKSPMTLGRDRAEGNLVKPETFPDGYSLSTGGVFFTTKNKDGDDVHVRVSMVPILSIRVHDVIEHDNGDSTVVPHIHMEWCDRTKRQYKGMFPMSALAEYRRLTTALQGIRFPLYRQDYTNGFDTFMTSWVQSLRERGAVTAGKPQFGWHLKDDKCLGFVIGRTMYLPDGGERTMMWPDSQLNHIYTQAGNIDEWRKAVALMQKRNRPELMVLIAGAFAGPLFSFLGESSAVVSAVSRASGVGKSSALKVAQAVWGDPKVGITALDDTVKSVARKMGVIKHLPVFWDELRLTDETAQEFLQMMFQLSQGRERTRLTSAVDFRETGTWETILVCASNNRLADMTYDPVTRSNANLKRLFEYEISYDGETPTSSDGIEVFGNLRYHYGHAGVMYAKYLVAHFADVKRAVLDTYQTLYKMVGAKNEDRFWVGTMTCLIVGAKLATKAGIMEFDHKGLTRFLLDTFSSMQATEVEVVEEDPARRLLQDFIHEHEGGSIIYRTRRPRQGPHNDEPQILRGPSDLRRGLVWEYFGGSAVLRVRRTSLIDFLRAKRMRRKDFLEELEALGYQWNENRVEMGWSTRFSSVTRPWCVELTVPVSDRASLVTVLPASEEGQ